MRLILIQKILRIKAEKLSARVLFSCNLAQV